MKSLDLNRNNGFYLRQRKVYRSKNVRCATQVLRANNFIDEWKYFYIPTSVKCPGGTTFALPLKIVLNGIIELEIMERFLTF